MTETYESTAAALRDVAERMESEWGGIRVRTDGILLASLVTLRLLVRCEQEDVVDVRMTPVVEDGGEGEAVDGVYVDIRRLAYDAESGWWASRIPEEPQVAVVGTPDDVQSIKHYSGLGEVPADHDELVQYERR